MEAGARLLMVSGFWVARGIQRVFCGDVETTKYNSGGKTTEFLLTPILWRLVLPKTLHFLADFSPFPVASFPKAGMLLMTSGGRWGCPRGARASNPRNPFVS